MRFLLALVFSVLISLTVNAKTIDQKKEELKKIYEAGGISKIEYDKANEFLDSGSNKEEKKNKQILKIKKKSKNKGIQTLSKKILKKNENNEKIRPEDLKKLGEIIKFDESYYPKNMKKVFIGCNNSFKCRGKKASKFMMSNFGKSSSWGQKYPGKMIQSMAMYEIFYASRLYQSRKSIERYKKNKYKKNNLLFTKKKDEKSIRSLIGMNNGRENMRKALGMTLETPSKEAIKKFWLLGGFLELGEPKKNNVSEELSKKQAKLNDYKKKISSLKKKLEERAENN